MECGNLGNISYPFWGSASCAASASFVLSNCTTSNTSQVSWDSFSAAQYGTSGLLPPLVMEGSGTLAVTYHNLSYLEPDNPTKIGLTWNMGAFLTIQACDSRSLFSSKTFSQYSIPASINLTGFANSAFQFSSAIPYSFHTAFLLFNCTNKASMSQMSSPYYELMEESADCVAYKQLCNYTTEISCINLQPHKELPLQHVMDTLACSHFTFGLMSVRYEPIIIQWTTGLVQLFWTNNECERCKDAGGFCVYDVPHSPGKLLYCDCGNARIHNFTTQYSCHSTGCYHGLMQCYPILKIIAGVAVSLIATMLVLMAIYCRAKIREGFRGFSMKLAHFAISVLKKTLRKLQGFSNRPRRSFRDMDLEGLTERPVEYSYSSIASATKSFSSVLGKGGFGIVYKGTLPAQASTQRGSGIQIAVKVLEMRSGHSKKQFLNEMGTIGRIHHLNVVRLLGFCLQEDHEMLVYEYVANGSLDRWLFEKSAGDDKKGVLDWGQRFAIAVGIARGLNYLHEECRHRTVHCDIKPQNILLDEWMCPKIADFGLARLMAREESQVVTLAKGTPGYMAPEFWMGGESQLSTKFDVYSYGMVLLELMSGCRNFADSGRCFPAVAFEAAMQGDLETILDDHLRITMNAYCDDDEAQRMQLNQIRTVAFVALWCIQDQPASRPYMSEVVQYLEGVAVVPHNPPKPTCISTSSTSITPSVRE